MKSLIAITTALAVSTAPALAEIKQGDHAAELDAIAANGKHFRLKDMAGKWVLFTFGASWCQPCHKELPAWDKIAPKFAGKLLFVAVNIDTKPDDGKAFVKNLGLKHIFPVFLSDENSPALKAYDPDKMPSTFVVDPQGTIQLIEYGYNAGDEDKLAAKLNDLIK